MRLMNSQVAFTDGDTIALAGVVTMGESPSARVTVYEWQGNPLNFQPGDRWQVVDAIDHATITKGRDGSYRIVGHSKVREMSTLFPDSQVDLVVVPGATCEGCNS